MPRTVPESPQIRASRHFFQLDLRWRVALSQLPLTSVVVLLCVILALFSPSAFGDPMLLAGLGLLAVLTVASLAVPWGRTPYGTYWVIPLLDFLAVFLIMHGTRPMLSGAALLTIFPVFWLAWSEVAPWAARVISFVVPLAIVWSPVLLEDLDPTPEQLVAPLLLPLATLAVCVTASVFSGSESAKQRALVAKEEQLQQALRESREAARLLDTLVNTVGVGLVVVDRGGRIAMVNERQRQNHHIVSPEGGHGHNDAGLLVFGADRARPLPPDRRPPQRAAAGEEFTDELIWIGEGDLQRALSVTARPIRDESGDFDGSVIAFSDVTELVDALEAKDHFISSVSHELRTPLTSIVGYLELALDELAAVDPEGIAAHSVRVAQRNSERLHHLVDDLLTTASDTMEVRPRVADLAEVVRASVASAAPKAREAGVVLEAEVPPELPGTLDPDRMGQVLDNLVSNSIKYTPRGGHVLVGAEAVEGELLVTVRDTGIGIPPEEQDGIFTKFFRTRSVRRAAIPGVGLGLVISKAIVEAHGGEIGFLSAPGQGTTFEVTIPHR